jgi:starch synthase (maltosyl-transferring)
MSNASAKRRPQNPRRIVYVITDLDVGGAEKCCAQLAMGLDRSRWQSSVCSLSPPGAMAERIAHAGIPVYSLGARHGGDAPWALWRLVRLLTQIQPVLVHTFLFHANVVGRVAASLAGTSHIVSSIRVAEKRYRHHWVLENVTCRLSDQVVCVSDAVAAFTRRHSRVPLARLTVIPNGIDTSTLLESRGLDRTVLGVPSHGIAGLYVGRLDVQKGVDVLLHALALAQRHSSGLHIVIAGAGPEQASLVDLARQLHIDSHVHFLGWRDDVPALLRAADFFVLPSRWEGMPNAVLEAMAAGLPVIATRVEGLTQLVRDGETGKLVGIDRPEELAEAMIELAGDRAARARYGRNAQEIARHQFSLSHMIAQYEQLYESLLSGVIKKRIGA